MTTMGNKRRKNVVGTEVRRFTIAIQEKGKIGGLDLPITNYNS
jgi:hypothetical protein